LSNIALEVDFALSRIIKKIYLLSVLENHMDPNLDLMELNASVFIQEFWSSLSRKTVASKAERTSLPTTFIDSKNVSGVII
jgi:hypothetical protein